MLPREIQGLPGPQRTWLDLQPGHPGVAHPDMALALPSGDEWRRLDPAAVSTHMAAWQDSCGLNFWEAELLSKFLRATRHGSMKLYPVVVTVESPRLRSRRPLPPALVSTASRLKLRFLAALSIRSW